ncbi:MAG: glutamine-hydrolyzing GMP synthase, partial [Nitrospirae bacterium]|nr:glutamine-hydrolyzing GMP synthase [Nitrospirota bacterium]
MTWSSPKRPRTTAKKEGFEVLDIHHEKILVLDFGSQYTQLIARRIRESQVYSEIMPFNVSPARIKQFRPKGIILSGGPSSVYQKDAPICSPKIFELGVPILGICYGMQLMTHLFGGRVGKAARREFGKAHLQVDDASDLLKSVGKKTVVWMSHGDKIDAAPAGFEPIAHTGNSPIAAMRDRRRRFYGLQFHPEVAHTPEGMRILQNFAYQICGCSPSWTMKSFLKYSV